MQHIEIGNIYKTNALTTVKKDNYIMYHNLTYRELTSIECERLQTIDDNYTLADGNISNTNRYKMLGNGWTIDVIAHIFKNLPSNLDEYESYILPDYKMKTIIQERLF